MATASRTLDLVSRGWMISSSGVVRFPSPASCCITDNTLLSFSTCYNEWVCVCVCEVWLRGWVSVWLPTCKMLLTFSTERLAFSAAVSMTLSTPPSSSSLQLASSASFLSAMFHSNSSTPNQPSIYSWVLAALKQMMLTLEIPDIGYRKLDTHRT